MPKQPSDVPNSEHRDQPDCHVGAEWIAEYFLRSQNAWTPIVNQYMPEGRLLTFDAAIEAAQGDRDWAASLGFPALVRIRNVKTRVKILLP